MSQLPATVLQKLNPFSTIRGIAARSADFFDGEVRDFYRKVVCPKEADGIPMLLTGIFLLLQQLAEANTGANTLTQTPVKVPPVGAVRALDRRTDSRPRRVFIWVDSSTTLPADFELRWSLDANMPGALLQPGMVNEIGMVPALAQIYLKASATPATGIQVLVVEEA